MKEERYHIALDDYEHGVVIRALNDTKTELMNEGKSTDAVDDLIIKVGYAPKSGNKSEKPKSVGIPTVFRFRPPVLITL